MSDDDDMRNLLLALESLSRSYDRPVRLGAADIKTRREQERRPRQAPLLQAVAP